MTKYVYIRVSSKDQNEDRQLMAIKELDIPKKNIFIDKQSGKDFNRPSYQKMLRVLKNGDILIIKSIDRLGRNYEEIMNQWRIITKEIGCDVVVLDMPLLDTTKSKDLLGTFISDLVLQLLSYVAQMERESIKQRQLEGILAAKARGVKFGRPCKPIPESFDFFYEKWKKGMISSRKAGELLGVSHQTFLRWKDTKENFVTKKVGINV